MTSPSKDDGPQSLANVVDLKKVLEVVEFLRRTSGAYQIGFHHLKNPEDPNDSGHLRFYFGWDAWQWIYEASEKELRDAMFPDSYFLTYVGTMAKKNYEDGNRRVPK